MKRKLSFVVIGVVAVALAVFLLTDIGDNNTATEMTTDDIKQLVHDYTVDNKTAEAASITSEALIVTDGDDGDKTYDLPEDAFFVSIAPFVNETHPCGTHSLTGCQGEMVNEEFSIHIEDQAGNVVLDETRTSEANGFMDLWLPRDKTYNVTIKHDGKTTVSEISTFDGDDTCVTSMQLT